MDNGLSHYRANNDNRNKMIWNNTHFRLFDRDNPNTLEIMAFEDTIQKSNKDIGWRKEYQGKMPHEIPEIR
eukprot:CAMPEP_0170558008 /NCGR_PEP_ID=MMETSP0211-20121228/32055_1 /TAXON_ID=311385 /ORGANISM="Pseudokeronopsis sp., Strain OXSARD2" /LENGTH=70 /DNA_ID=CAMNT_0010869541 /DNA_START=225 /DNA_END=437 /DNA_ORIENTATION=+